MNAKAESMTLGQACEQIQAACGKMLQSFDSLFSNKLLEGSLLVSHSFHLSLHF